MKFFESVTPLKISICLVLIIGGCTSNRKSEFKEGAGAQAIPLPQTTNVAVGIPGMTVLERGPHDRLVEVRSPGPGGVLETNRYRELQNGLHYFEDNEWKETEETIELIEGGAKAHKGPHKVTFAANINTPNAIDLETPDGKRFKSKVFGLAYYDASSGESSLIAEIKDSVGQLISSNQILYPDAFTDFQADVRFTYTKEGFEQDIILRQRPPSPVEYQMNPDTVQLQVMTEFFDPPKVKGNAGITTNGLFASNMVEADEVLDFGDVKMGKGRAFTLIDETEVGLPSQRDQGKPVRKKLKNLEGRDFLFESIDYPAIVPELNQLPDAPPVKEARLRNSNKTMAQILGNRPKTLHSDPKRKQRIEVAQAKPKRGFAIDYVLLNTATNFTFQSDTTYYVTSTFTLTEVTTIEGGTVVKYTNGAKINLNGLVNCQTGPYRMAVFTSKDDNSVGEIISGSTGTPSGYYASIALNCDENVNDLSHIRIAFAKEAIYYGNQWGGYRLDHSQILHCQKGITAYTPSIILNNLLMENVLTNFSNPIGGVASVRCEHVTVHKSERLNGTPTTCYPNFTNSLFVAVTNLGGMTGGFNESSSSDVGVFATVGAGSHYLPEGSLYRNAGTTNISSRLRRELGKKTTDVPIVISNETISFSTTWSPQSKRDTDVPDLGYHYDPIDFAISDVTITNATLLLTNGVAVGIFGTEGIKLKSGGNLISEGNPVSMIQIGRYQGVQEQSIIWGTTNAQMIMIRNYGSSASPFPAATFKFTRFSVPSCALSLRWIFFDTGSNFEKVSFSDCQLQGNLMSSTPGQSASVISLTNNLLERTSFQVTSEQGSSGSLVFYAYNNLFFGGAVYFYYFDGDPPSHPWAVHDNVFYSSVNDYEGSLFGNSHNAYINSWSFPGSGGGDVILTDFKYVTGPLGRYYQWSTNLVNAGSRNSTNAGLFHYTTQLEQAKEGSSQVDIGFHYVAVTNLTATTNVWVNDSPLPSGSILPTDAEAWDWTAPQIYAGTEAHISPLYSGVHQHYFYGTTETLTLTEDDTIFTYYNGDGTNLPGTIMLQMHAPNFLGWGHCANWGSDVFSVWGGTRNYLGPLPPSVGWLRLEIPATAVNLHNRTIDGMAFTLYGGKVMWDYSGVVRKIDPDIPIDSDGDGLADYFEDKNGNGSYDSPDYSNFNSANTDDPADSINDYEEWLLGRNPKTGVAADTANAINLKIYTPLKLE